MICFFHWACQFLLFLGRFTVFLASSLARLLERMSRNRPIVLSPAEKTVYGQIQLCANEKILGKVHLFFFEPRRKREFLSRHTFEIAPKLW